MDPLTLTACLPLMLNAIAWGAKQAPGAATAAQSIAAAAESGASLVELVTKAKSVFNTKPRHGVLLRRCLLITGLAVRAAQEVAPPATKAKRAALVAEVKLAWDVCAATVPDPEDEAALGNALNDWLAPPLSTPWGRALWGVLARRQTKKRGPTLATAEERRAFERRFMAAWSLNTSTGEGEALEREVRGLRALDAARLREQLVADLASWGGRHVFGNLRAGAELQGMPWMSLEAVYVQPTVAWEEEVENDEPIQQSGPALRTLWDAVQTHPLTLVTADMGLGKTLTARSFMLERALDWLEAKDAPGERWMPVYVRCADHLRAEQTDLEKLVAAAWMGQWEGLTGEKLSARDPRLNLPREETRLVIVLDGLDEVHLSHAMVAELLRKVHADECCETLRVVVFSRPGAVPTHDKLPNKTHMLEVQPFEEAQVNEWLGRWRALCQAGPASMTEVHEDRIKDLLTTPVLLFMLAWTWHSYNGQLPGVAALYEQFLRRVAQGKADHDRERHPVIAEASKDARARLIERKHLSPGATPEDGMLWMLGRVALEVHRREQTPSSGPLNRRGVENLVEKLMGLSADAKALELVSLACVLAMQADLRGDQPVLLFGHRSFQEFLVARAWREQLRQIVGIPKGREREELEEELEGLIIQGNGDQTIHFLMELVRGEDPSQRASLKDWARGMVEDQRVGPLQGRGADRRAAHTDTRAPLALAAFAIGGALAGEEGFIVNSAWPLRRVLAWLWLTQQQIQIIAPRLGRPQDGEAWGLIRANMIEANLSGGNLSGANLSGANLTLANLSGANLALANLSDACLFDASLLGANFMDADLSDAYFSGANLSGANLSGADLPRAYLFGANLPYANLQDANLCGAHLRGSDLSHADLSCVNLSGANLSDANLSDANLFGANLSHTDLTATDLATAKNLPNATLHNVRFTLDHLYLSDTLWPPGFDPITAGARPNLRGEDTWPDPHFPEADPDE